MKFCGSVGFTARGVSFWAVVSFVTFVTKLTVGLPDTDWVRDPAAGALTTSEGERLSLQAAKITAQKRTEQER